MKLTKRDLELIEIALRIAADSAGANEDTEALARRYERLREKIEAARQELSEQ